VSYFRNKKSDKDYWVLETVIDQTSKNVGKPCVIYYEVGHEKLKFVCDAGEFYKKHIAIELAQILRERKTATAGEILGF
jgi:hypothetical protein